MTYTRGFRLLAETNTGKAMIGGSILSSTATAALLRRRGVGAAPTVAAGAALALAQLGAIAWFGHRLVVAGEKLADEFLGELDPDPEPANR